MKKSSLLILSLVLVLMLVMSMAGCGKAAVKTIEATTAEKTEATSSETSKETTAAETTKATAKETTAETTIKETANTGAMSDNLYDFTVKLNGVVYKLPCLYSEIAANGWVADFGTETIDPGYYDIANAKNGDITIAFDIANLGVDTIPYADGYIGGFSYGILEHDKGCTLELAKGITYGSTKEAVIAAYGEPTRNSKGDSYTTLSYESDTYSTYKFMINNDTGLVDSIAIKNLVISEAAAPTDTTSGEVPAVVTSYVAPTELGTDLMSFNVNYGGSLYNLPAPMAEFIKNGWTVQDGAGTTVVAKGYLVGVTLSKDNQTLTTTVNNYADKATTVENCFVTVVMFDENRTKTTIELPGGITENSSYNEMITAYGKPDDVDETSASFHYYTYGSIWEEVEIIFNTETNKVSAITVQHDPEDFSQ